MNQPPPDWFPWVLFAAIFLSIPLWSVGFKGTAKLIARIPGAIARLAVWVLAVIIGIYVIGGIAGLLLFGWKQF